MKWNAPKLLYHKPWLEVCHQFYHIIILCVWNSVTNCLGLNVVKVAHDMNHLLVSVYPLSSTSMVSSTGLSTHCLLAVSSTTFSLPAVFYRSLSTCCLLPVSLYLLSFTGLSLPGLFYWSLSLQLPPSALLCLQLCLRINFKLHMLPSQLHIEISAKIPVFFKKKKKND